MKKNALLIAILLISQSPNPLATPAFGSPDHDHSHTEKIEIPEALADLWKAIQTEHAALLKAVNDEDDGAVHKSEGQLQAYLKALPEKIADLGESTRKRIEGQTRNLARAYDAVHHAADDKVWEKASSEMKKAGGGIALLTAQMPKQ